jgi:hypothetical protein
MNLDQAMDNFDLDGASRPSSPMSAAPPRPLSGSVDSEFGCG